MKWLLDSVTETGTVSSTRVMMLATCAVVLLVFAAQNVASIIRGSGVVDFTAGMMTVLGIVLGGKVAQAFAERKQS